MYWSGVTGRELVGLDRRVGRRVERELADVRPHEPADRRADGLGQLDLARHSPGLRMAVGTGACAVSPDLALDGLGAGTQEDPPSARTPAPGGGGQGGDHDRQDEDRHVEKLLGEWVLGQVAGLVEHGLCDHQRRDGQPQRQRQQLRPVVVMLLLARRCRDDPLLAPRLAERLVNSKVARQHAFEIRGVRVDRDQCQVALDHDGADGIARLRLRLRSGDRCELVGQATGPLDHDDRHSAFDRETDLVDRVRPTAREDRHGGPRCRQLVERLEEQRGLAAPLVAVGEDEVRVIWLELRRSGGSVVLVTLERDLSGGRDAQVRRGGVAGGDCPSEHRHDPGRRPTVHQRRAGLRRRADDPSFEEPLQASLDGRVERIAPPMTSRIGVGELSWSASSRALTDSRGPARTARATFALSNVMANGLAPPPASGPMVPLAAGPRPKRSRRPSRRVFGGAPRARGNPAGDRGGFGWREGIEP